MVRPALVLVLLSMYLKVMKVAFALKVMKGGLREADLGSQRSEVMGYVGEVRYPWNS